MEEDNDEGVCDPDDALVHDDNPRIPLQMTCKHWVPWKRGRPESQIALHLFEHPLPPPLLYPATCLDRGAFHVRQCVE